MHIPLHFYLTATYLSIFFNKMWNRNYEEDIFLSVKDFINTNINPWHLERKLEIINRDSNVYKHVYKDEKLFLRLLKMDYGFSVFIFRYHGHALVQFWTSPPKIGPIPLPFTLFKKPTPTQYSVHTYLPHKNSK